MSKTVKFFIGFLTLIIGTGAALALYYRPSFLFPPETDNDNVIATFNSENDSNIEETVVPNPTGIVSLTTAPFVASVYIDGNNNGTKDNGEGPCVSCLIRQMVCAKSISNNVLPKTSDLFNVTIKAGGALSTENLLDGNVCWASLDDKKVFIAPFTFMVGDSSIAVDVPSISANAIISGVNTHIKSITNTADSGHLYAFDLLIPILKTQYTDKKDVWVKYTPNLSTVDAYFIKPTKIEFDADGSITGVENTYYIKLNWGFSENYSTDKTVENYTIIM